MYFIAVHFERLPLYRYFGGKSFEKQYEASFGRNDISIDKRRSRKEKLSYSTDLNNVTSYAARRPRCLQHLGRR